MPHSPFTPSLLHRYGNHFLPLVAEWHLWRQSCLQIQGEVASLPLSFLCCRFQSSNPWSYGMRLEIRRKVPLCAYMLPPSWCPPDICNTVFYRKGVPGHQQSRSLLGSDILQFSVVFSFLEYFLRILFYVSISAHLHCTTLQ